MDEADSLPKAISHKRLNSYLQSASGEQINHDGTSNESGKKPDLFKESASNLIQSARTTLDLLEQDSLSITNSLTKQQALALGAFQVHLKMVVQAYSLIYDVTN